MKIHKSANSAAKTGASPKTGAKYLWGNKSDEKYLLSINDSFIKSSEPDDSLFIPNGKKLEKWHLTESQRGYKAKLRNEQLKYAKWGSVIGGLVCSKSALGLIGGVVGGAAIGAYMAWDKISDEEKGTVTVEMDGENFSQPYYVDPYSYEKSPELEKALSEKQEKIGLPDKSSSVEPDVDKGKLEQLKAHSGKLVELGKERRLVADLGQKSLQGKAALNLIDPNKAKELIASGKPVFIVNGEKVIETPKTYKAKASNKGRNVALNEFHDLLEKEIDYSLQEIKSPEDLSDIKDGKGIPEGLLGVYKDERSYKEIVYNKAQQGFFRADNSFKEKKLTENYSSHENSRIEKPSIETKRNVRPGVGNYKNLGFMMGLGAFMTIGLVGTFSGLVPPAVVPALEAGGAVIGYNVGKKLMKNPKILKWLENR